MMPGDDATVPLQTYIDAQLHEVRRAVEVALTSDGGEAVPLREHFNAILAEHREGLATASDEREKSAQALAHALENQIDKGDRALREHIDQQVYQIRAALEAAEALDVQRHISSDARIKAVHQRLDEGDLRLREHIQAQYGQISAALEAARRETLFAHESSERAIAKAEAANEKRFEGVNEFRAQLADQSASFLPREVAEAQFAELRRTIADLAEKVGKLA